MGNRNLSERFVYPFVVGGIGLGLVVGVLHDSHPTGGAALAVLAHNYHVLHIDHSTGGTAHVFDRIQNIVGSTGGSVNYWG